jgi:hypothetical protein
MTNAMKLTPDQLNALAEEAMHLAFAHLCEALDPNEKHDLGGFFGYQTEALADRVQADLLNAAELANDAIHD